MRHFARLVKVCAIATILCQGSLSAQELPVAAPVAVGVNAFFPQWPATAGQGAAANELSFLAPIRAARIGLIRTDLNDGSAIFNWPQPGQTQPGLISRAFALGIETNLVVGPTSADYIKSGSCPRPPLPHQPWGTECLSEIDLPAWRSSLTSANVGGSMFAQLNVLDRQQGVRLAALEVMNEINWGQSDGDFFSHGTGDIADKSSGCPVNPIDGQRRYGRILSLDDLANPTDPEARQIATGFRRYVAMLATIKAWRDASLNNKTTPIILGGLTDFGKPTHSFDDDWDNCIDDVTAQATIRYMRGFGLDRYVDGYGIHSYPPSVDPTTHRPFTVEQRLKTLEDDTFSECTVAEGKPCWLTEWGFRTFPAWPHGSCPLEAATDPAYATVAVMKDALAQFSRKYPFRLASIEYFEWPWADDNTSGWGIYGAFPFCGSEPVTGLTASGNLATRSFTMRMGREAQTGDQY